jgi:hypothetical protein
MEDCEALNEGDQNRTPRESSVVFNEPIANVQTHRFRIGMFLSKDSEQENV